MEMKENELNNKAMFNIFRKILFIFITGIMAVFTSCEDFFHPEQELVRDKDEFFQSWHEYRAAEMGLYSIQQDLVEQLLILGELRADLLKITENADRDLIEVYNFEVSKTNKYASPVNFYRLIGACNSLKSQLEKEHPEVLDKNEEPTRYDRMYGEVLCMRAWAYFNAVRIFRKVPYIHSSLTSVDEIENYVNSAREYKDSVHVIYGQDGYHNDTIRDTTIILEKSYLEMNAVIDTFTYELENKVKAVGVIHNKDFDDQSWDVTIWNNYARQSLLGQMYLYEQNYSKALEYFQPIMYNYESSTNDIKFGVDDKFQRHAWKNILTTIDPFEHIYTMWFDKSYQQTHELQTMFSMIFPNRHMLKPTKKAIENWESVWDGMKLDRNDQQPERTKLAISDKTNKPIRGTPGDFYRGYGVSYGYIKDGELIKREDIEEMLEEKAEMNYRELDNIMQGADTVVYKYSIAKQEYDNDANFMVYRAAGIHFYFAEIQVWRVFFDEGREKRSIPTSLQVINDGTYGDDPNQLGIRGRVGLSDGDEALYVGDVVYQHDPATNKVIGYKELEDLYQKQLYLEDIILEEKAREMAYEGERFYDIMRAAKRREDPSYLAEKVASKFSGAKKEEIYQKLLNENNWYIPLFEE
jgi:starch-binding outer membrane protein, SusD/RagB family